MIEPPASEPFSIEGYRGEVASGLRPGDLDAAVARLIDPGQARETLHWGRNYLYVTTLELPGGRQGDGECGTGRTGRTGGGEGSEGAGTTRSVPVVVKQFRNEGFRRRLERRLKGSKAERSWRVALALTAAGIDTPRPVMLIESEVPDGPSFYVCRYLEGSTEARYLLRAATAGEAAERFPELPMGEFLDRLAGLIRTLHAEGVWFRDMTSGNVLLRREDGDLRLWLVDLNRARLGRRLSLLQRSRDLSRMPIHRPEHQDRFLHAYWQVANGDGLPLRRGLYLLLHHGFLAKNGTKQRLRAWRSRLVGKVVPRGTHAHIPKPPDDAPSRERVVWDHLSDQPHLHATPLQKLAARLADGRAHLEEVATTLAAAPRILRRYRALSKALYREPVALFEGVPDPHLEPEAAPAAALPRAGVALRPWPDDPNALLELVEGLRPDRSGPLAALIRVHPWEPDGLDAEEELARALVERGHDVAFAVPQTRELVRRPEAWRAALGQIAARLTPYGRHFQIGQAINRSKWGVWTLDEYVELVRTAEAALRAARPDVEILGPAVIDFEYHATAATLNLRRKGFHLDAVAALLYVDRRGAPEATQVGFDTVDKVALLKAIAETGRNATPRCWITEVNWPLWEGPHSPAGRSVSVDEETQADYLVRYYLLALGTGLVERVYWWQMIARGYGLVCPEEDHLRRRPSYRALATLLRELGHATSLGPLESEAPARLHLYRRPDGTELAVGWSADKTPAQATLPRPAVRALTRDGEEIPPPDGPAVQLTPSPTYFVLA